MEKVYKRLILDFVTNREYRPVNETDLARSLNVPSEDNPAFRQAFKELLDQQKIIINQRGLIDLPRMAGTVIGTFQKTLKGFGFVIPREATSGGDVFIPKECTLDALSGDTVMARVRRKGFFAKTERFTGEIIEVVERGQKRFSGTLKKKKNLWVVVPDGKVLSGPIIVGDVGAKGGRVDDKASVDIIEYPHGDMPARGVIVEILGRAGHYDAELKSTIASYDLPGEFDDKCLDQARNAGVGFEASSEDNILDLTNETIITIDPPDAKDFDDAISLRKNSDGSFVLGVHIADVSRFIPMGSPLDNEAKSRGNSVYLPGKVIPMLPEILSNGICSLQPDQKRYAKTVYITYDQDGKVLGSEFANSLISSIARLTYLEADSILHGNAKGFSGEVVSLLKDMETLAKAIEKRRIDDGMIQLDLPETELIMDADGKVVDAEPAENSYPHTIIEMFMVEANVAVASMLDRFQVPFMRRIHPDPDSYSIKRLSNYVRVCNMRLPRKLDRRSMQLLIRKVRGTSYEFAINNYILRSLQRAEYAPLNIGHFALASRHYCHFTSPIRRYADLLVHRLVQCYIEEKLNKIGLEEVIPESELMHIGKHISCTEQNSMEAERDLKKVLILQMLSDRVGDEMNCVVSGMTKFSVFVQCLKFGVEGMIPLHELGLDEWRYDERQLAVIGLNSGKRVCLGDPMPVRIVSVNVPARHLEVAPLEPVVSKRQGRKSRKKSKKPQTRSSGRRKSKGKRRR